MMPTFPSPSLKFRTAGFPQYGFKAGLSGGAFPAGAWPPRLSVCCRPSCFAPSTIRSPYSAGGVARFSTTVRTALAVLPRGSSLRSGLCCPGPSSLNRPHPPHSQAHRDFAALRLIRNAFAVRSRLGDPRVVPCFRCSSRLDMPSSTTPGSPSVVCTQFLHRRRWPSPRLERLGTPKLPTIRFRWDGDFGATLVRFPLRPAELFASLTDLSGHCARTTEAFTSGLSTGRSPFPSPDIATAATGQVPPAGPSPAGTAASIAAPNPSPYDSFIHSTMPV